MDVEVESYRVPSTSPFPPFPAAAFRTGTSASALSTSPTTCSREALSGPPVGRFSPLSHPYTARPPPTPAHRFSPHHHHHRETFSLSSSPCPSLSASTCTLEIEELPPGADANADEVLQGEFEDAPEVDMEDADTTRKPRRGRRRWPWTDDGPEIVDQSDEEMEMEMEMGLDADADTDADLDRDPYDPLPAPLGRASKDAYNTPAHTPADTETLLRHLRRLGGNAGGTRKKRSYAESLAGADDDADTDRDWDAYSVGGESAFSDRDRDRDSDGAGSTRSRKSRRTARGRGAGWGSPAFSARGSTRGCGSVGGSRGSTPDMLMDMAL